MLIANKLFGMPEALNTPQKHRQKTKNRQKTKMKPNKKE